MSLVRQIPLPAAVLVTPVVALAREVDPLGVPQLVAHEVQVGLAPEGHGDEPNHLVQGHAPDDDLGGLVQRAHAFVHLGAHQPEGDRLVPDQRLVVTLGVSHRLLGVPAVAERVDELGHLPVLVADVFQVPDPEVRQAHPEPVVKADAAVVHPPAQSRHPRHVLSDGDGRRDELMRELVRQHQVHDRVGVGGHRKVLVVVARKADVDPVVVIQHAGDAVEPEPVKVVLVEPVLDVGQQIAQRLVAAVIEQPRVPLAVVAGVALQKVVLAPTLPEVKPGQAVVRVAGDVRVHDIQEHADPELVRLVHQVLEVLGRARPGAHGERVGDVVAERRVVCVLLDGHQLDRVISALLDAGKDVVCKIPVRRHLLVRRGHAHVRLVNLERLLARVGVHRTWTLVLPNVPLLLPRIPVDAIVLGTHLARLDRGPGDPGRQPVHPPPFRVLQADLDPTRVRYRRLAVHVRHSHRPHAKVVALHVPALPVVEVADELGAHRARRPLAVHGGALLLVPNEPVLRVERAGERRQGARVRLDRGKGALELIDPEIEVLPVVADLGVAFEQRRDVDGVSGRRLGCRGGSDRHGRTGSLVGPHLAGVGPGRWQVVSGTLR